jgi:Cupin-like domain
VSCAGAVDGTAREMERWIAARLFAGSSAHAVVDHLVAIGHADAAARALVEGVQRMPAYEVAGPLLERARKLEALVLLLGALWSRSGEAGQPLEVAALDCEGFREVVLRNIPVVVRGAAASWPATERWKPERLAADFGSVPVEYVAGPREVDLPAELAERTQRTTLEAFVRKLTARPVSNELYIVARNFSLLQPALRPLLDDVRPPDFLDLGPAWMQYARLWLGPRGTLTPLHHDLMPNVFVQVVGHKRFIMVHPAFTPLIPNPRGVYSDSDPLTWPHDAVLRNVPRYDFTLGPGDVVYIPPAWWHWVFARSVSASLSLTGFPFEHTKIAWERTGVSPLVGLHAPTAQHDRAPAC